MSVRLLHDLLAVRETQREEISDGGIQLVKAEKQHTGEVVAAGPGMHLPNGKFVETVTKPGDEIIFTKEAGEEVSIDGETLLVMPEGNVIGIISSANTDGGE